MRSSHSPGAAAPANKIPDGKSGAELECPCPIACFPIPSLDKPGTTEGHPRLTALRRPWLRADRRRLALTSLSRQPATTLGCPRSPAARRPGGAVSVVGNEAGQGRPASGCRFERSQGWHSEIKRAAPPEGRAAVERGTRLGYPSRRPATCRNFSGCSHPARGECLPRCANARLQCDWTPVWPTAVRVHRLHSASTPAVPARFARARPEQRPAVLRRRRRTAAL